MQHSLELLKLQTTKVHPAGIELESNERQYIDSTERERERDSHVNAEQVKRDTHCILAIAKMRIEKTITDEENRGTCSTHLVLSENVIPFALDLINAPQWPLVGEPVAVACLLPHGLLSHVAVEGVGQKAPLLRLLLDVDGPQSIDVQIIGRC